MKKSSLSTLLKIPESEISSSLEKSRLAIKKHRKSRIAPGTDDKIIVSWNGLMISSLAKVSAFLDDKEYFEIADRAVSFIVDKMSKEDGSLNRVYRDNLSHIDAFAEAYFRLIFSASSIGGDNSLLKVIREKYLPCKIIGESSSQLDIPLLKDKGPLGGKSTAYICKNYACRGPVTNDKALKNQLK